MLTTGLDSVRKSRSLLIESTLSIVRVLDDDAYACMVVSWSMKETCMGQQCNPARSSIPRFKKKNSTLSAVDDWSLPHFLLVGNLLTGRHAWRALLLVSVCRRACWPGNIMWNGHASSSRGEENQNSMKQLRQTFRLGRALIILFSGLTRSSLLISQQINWISRYSRLNVYIQRD